VHVPAEGLLEFLQARSFDRGASVSSSFPSGPGKEKRASCFFDDVIGCPRSSLGRLLPIHARAEGGFRRGEHVEARGVVAACAETIAALAIACTVGLSGHLKLAPPL